MATRNSIWKLVLLTALLGGCDDDDELPPDPVDAGTDSGGGNIDAGSPGIDGGLDAALDAGVDALVQVQVLAFNDFHGNIEPPAGSSGAVVLSRGDGGTVSAGGAAYFARHIASLRAENPNTVVVSAGDLIGASPLASALFHDEPTIEAMNLIGLDINGVGNHEFDEGRTELLRMQRGGCHPTDGCQDGTPFAGAQFTFLAANVKTESGETLFPRYTVRTFEGVKVAFIGMTLEGTPSIVTPSGVAGLSFLDEAETVNALVPELVGQGIRAIVVVIHEGGFQTGLLNDCTGISGEIVGIVGKLAPEVDLVLSGHTHASYNCLISGKRVTSALSFGRLVTQVKLAIDPVSQDVVAVDAVNRAVTRDVTPVAAVDSLVNGYVSMAAPLRDRVIGTASAPLTRTGSESTLGDVIADSQRAATYSAIVSLPQVAFMNPGGIRADLDAGPITYGEAFTIQPFGNSLVTMTLTGAQLKTLLEQQFTATTTRILSPSFNVSYTLSASAPLGARVSLLSVDGALVLDGSTYRVTVNSFLATGGDGFLVLNDGVERVGGAVDVDALEAYLKANDPIAPPALTRITTAP